jgi:hypothetical protein
MSIACNIATGQRLARDEVSEIRHKFSSHPGMRTIYHKFELTREDLLAVCRHGRPQHSRNKATKRTN